MTTLKPPSQTEEVKTRISVEQRESFFDDDDIDLDPFDNRRKLWIKPQKTHLNSLKANNILYEGLLLKKGKKTKLQKVRYYILTPDFLAYKEVRNKKKCYLSLLKKPNSTSIKKILILERTRLEFYKSQDKKDKAPKFGFYFSRNKRAAKIFTREQSVYEGFKNHLSRLCILSSFIEDYSIIKLIGQGSYGKVYLVKRKSDGVLFATKMFQKEVLLSQSKGKPSLINEVRILRKLSHPGVMTLYEVHETRVSISLIMELLDGGELFERLHSTKRYSENDCALMLRKILEPLLYMHENEIMHRDIKPENLILRSKESNFDIVIADFGLAQELKKKFLHIKCGTPGYCAPEILASKASKPEYDLKCDVFSVGCVFYQIVTGDLPFPARNVGEMFELNKKCEISFEDPKIKALSPQAQDLLQLMLTKDPTKRPTLAQCLNHNFFFEANKRVSEVVISFVHQSVNLFGRTFHREKSHGSMNDEFASFVVGRSNIMRGHLDTVQEMTVVSAAVGVQNMLGMQQSRTQTAIQQKLTTKHTTESRNKLPISENNLKDDEQGQDEVADSSFASLVNNDANNWKENQSGDKKRIKVIQKMKSLESHVKIRNPFQSALNTKGC